VVDDRRIAGGSARMPGQFSAAAPLPDGGVLITGGYGQGHGPRASAWIYEPPQPEPDRDLQAFRAWLDREHKGYGCDEGPARFRNPTVERAYPARRFYFVLTYTRGIAPPYAKSLSVVASVDDSGVHPLSVSSPPTYQPGLMRIGSAEDARRAAAAVLILSTCDPNERRWKLDPDRFQAKRESGGWVCTYSYDPNHASRVRFDRSGMLVEVTGYAPPVP
jgi:hypothetical protein